MTDSSGPGCLNVFDVIQSQQLCLSFKLIISFTYYFKFDAQDFGHRKT